MELGWYENIFAKMFSYPQLLYYSGCEVLWKKQWGASLFCSHGANNARGFAFLIRNNFDCIVEETVIDTNGRFIILKVLLNGE